MTVAPNEMNVPCRIVHAVALNTMLKKHVRPGSVIHVDIWKGYIPSKLEEMSVLRVFGSF